MSKTRCQAKTMQNEQCHRFVPFGTTYCKQHQEIMQKTQQMREDLYMRAHFRQLTENKTVGQSVGIPRGSAIAQSTHTRLGEKSPMSLLPQHLMKDIVGLSLPTTQQTKFILAVTGLNELEISIVDNSTGKVSEYHLINDNPLRIELNPVRLRLYMHVKSRYGDDEPICAGTLTIAPKEIIGLKELIIYDIQSLSPEKKIDLMHLNTTGPFFFKILLTYVDGHERILKTNPCDMN
jgi:hypothetical protein